MSRVSGFLSAEWSQVAAASAHRTGRAGPGEEVRFPACRSISCSVPLSPSLARVASRWCSQVVNVERGGFQGWAPARLLTATVMWNMLAARCGPSVPARTPCSTSQTGTGGPVQFSSVQFSRPVVSDSLRPHESQHARPSCPSPTPGVHSNSHPSSQ